MSDRSKPRVFRIEPAPAAAPEADAPQRPAPARVEIAEQPDPFEPDAQPREVQLKPGPNRWSIWARLFWSAFTGLLGMAIGLWFWRLVEDLYRTNVYVGWAGLGLLALAVVALLALILREARGLARLSAAAALKEEAERAALLDDGAVAKRIIRRLVAYQAADPGTARQRRALEESLEAIADGRGLLTLADRTLMLPRDALAREAIALAAKRVSVVTAISPRAIVDILFVLAQSVMLTRRIADIYGARPGTLGFLGLGRRILGHLAITGGVAVTDSVLSQLVGHGLAARLSAKLGEGVLNGLLTARVGLAAIAACRPLPFLAAEEPQLQDVAGDILANPLGRKDG
jgi:putative membrane protein